MPPWRGIKREGDSKSSRLFKGCLRPHELVRLRSVWNGQDFSGKGAVGRVLPKRVPHQIRLLPIPHQRAGDTAPGRPRQIRETALLLCQISRSGRRWLAYGAS